MLLVSQRYPNIRNLRFKMWLMYKYSTARFKINGYTLRITGDIDRTSDFLKGEWKILEKWIEYADKISIASPIVFALPNPPNDFTKLRERITEISDRVIVGAHGFCCSHIHFNKVSTDSIISCINELKTKIVPLPKIFRFPYHNSSPRTLKLISKHFKADSSIGNSFFKPFELCGMVEYPIRRPTDTYFRESTPPGLACKVWKRIMETSKQRNVECTFNLHPNPYTLECFKIWKEVD